MAGKSSKAELPEGWVEKVRIAYGRKIKIYTNLETDQQFRSKAEVMRYVNRENFTQVTPEQPSQKSSSQQSSPKSTPQASSTKSTRKNPSPKSTRQQLGRRSISQQLEKQSIGPEQVQVRSDPQDEPKKETTPVTTNETEDWLPSGWTMEVKSSQGGSSREYKEYTDPSTGKKFSSKSQVLKHLKIAEQGDYVSKRKTRSHDREDCSPGKPNNPENGSPSKVKKIKVKGINKEKETVDDSPAELQESPDATLGDVIPTSEWLPSGWKTLVKKRGSGFKYKCYIDPTTGSKFYSKPDVIRHLNSEKSGGRSLPKKKIEVATSHETPMKTVIPTSEWLPSGWKTLVKTKSSGLNYKCYIDPTTGSKFYSKPAVIKHLNSEKSGGRSLPKKKIEVATSHGTPLKTVVIERGTPNLLPPGWIMEIKIERIGSHLRKDPFYTDPKSKFVFRSQPDALRFLETGDISKCRIKPKHRDDLDFLSGDISSLLEAARDDSQISQVQTTKKRRRNSAGSNETNADSCTLETKSDDTPSQPSKRQRKSRFSNETATSDEILDDYTPPSPPPKSQSPRKSTSSRKRANNAAKLPLAERRTSGRKKTVTEPKEPITPSRSSRRISNQLKPKATIDQPTSTEDVLPVQADPISSFGNTNDRNNTVRPSLAETLSDAFGLDFLEEEDYIEEVVTGVENSPTRNEETTNNELFNFESTSWCDLGNKESEPQLEPDTEPEPELEHDLAWLNRPLDFVLGKKHSTDPANPLVQDFRPQEDVTNKNVADNNQHQHDLGAPGFTNFNFHQQGNNNLQSSPTTGQFNFLPSSSTFPAVNQSPANPLFHSGIMSSPANPLFPPPDNNIAPNNNPSSPPANPANPMFPPGGF